MAPNIPWVPEGVFFTQEKHRRRRAQRTTAGSKIPPYRATAHARVVVHVKLRTLKRQISLPERT